MPIDDLMFPGVAESIEASEDGKVDDLEVNFDCASAIINNSEGNFIVDTTPELPQALTQIDNEVAVDIEEFVQCKTESVELMSINHPAQDVVPLVKEPSERLQIAKVKNEDGKEVKLFTNLDGVDDVAPSELIISASVSPTLENLTCPECNMTFDKSWKLNRHQKNPWLDRPEQHNQKRR